MEHDERKCVHAAVRAFLRECAPGTAAEVLDRAVIAALDVIEDSMVEDGGDWHMPGDGR